MLQEVAMTNLDVPSSKARETITEMLKSERIYSEREIKALYGARDDLMSVRNPVFEDKLTTLMDKFNGFRVRRVGSTAKSGTW